MNGSRGYSQEALKRLETGTYKGRQQKYRTSEEQVKAAPKKVPALEGMTRSPSFDQTGHVDTANARARYEQRIGHTPRGTVRPSTRYQNDTIKNELSRSKQSNRDTRYDKDFDNFYEWRYNKLGVTPDYDPLTDTNVEHWQQVKKDIMSKNGWTEKEFDEKFGEYDKERTQKMADEEVAGAMEVAKEHPIFGTLLQAAYTPQTWIEGGASILEGASAALGKLTGKNLLKDYTPTSSNDVQFTGTRLKEGVKQTVKDNSIKSSGGKFLYDVGTGLADVGMSSAVPVLGTATSGGQTASRQHMNALERGIDSEKAAMTGGATGLVSGAMNKVGLDWALGSEGKTALGTLAKAANREGIENVTEDIITLAIDKAINGDQSELDALHDYYVSQGNTEDAWLKVLADKGRDLVTSYGSGAALGGIMSGLRNIPALKADISSRVQNARSKKSAPVSSLDTMKTEVPTVQNNIIPVNSNIAETPKVNTPKDYSIQTVYAKDGSPRYFVRENIEENLSRNVEPGKVYKTIEEAEEVLNQYKTDGNSRMDSDVELEGADVEDSTNRVLAESAGLNPTKIVEVPTAEVPEPDDVEKVRSFSKRGSQDESLPDEIRNTLSEDYYKVVHNADTETRANSLFDADDLTQTRSNLDRAVEAHDPASALLSYKLAKAYIDNGDYDAATDVLQNVSAELTRMGQFTQAAKLAMLQNDPMAAMRAYMRDLENLNKWGKNKYKNKWNDLELSQEDIDLINSVQKGDSEGLSNVMDQLNAKFAKQVPASWWDKAVTASKTAMLLNLRTQSRNILANMATLPIRSASDRVSALGQNIAHLINPDIKVTQSLTGGTKEQKAIATEIWKQLKDEISGDNKMKDSVSSDILSQRQIFNDDFFAKWLDGLTNGGIQRLNEKLGANGNQSTMETLTNFTYWLMGDFGDTPFVKKNFINRLASYMKAQGINDINDVPDEAISIATQEALKATFKDDNAFTKALQGIKQKSGKFGEVALPFVKTPANLTMRAIDYSPAGLVNTFRKIKSGAEANAVIDELAKNLTGTAMIYLGYKLAEKGILSGAYSSDADEAAWQKQQGVLENAIHVGDNYYTYDWTQPMSTPLVIGQTIYEAVKASDDDNAKLLDVIDATYKGGLKVANTIINSSPLQSLSDLLGDNPYSEEGVAENFANEILEFPQRFIPSVLGATARTVDPTMRDTYIKDSSLTGTLGNQARSAMAKIPFLSKTLPASYDTWGNERTRSDSKGEAFFAQMINPGQLGNKNETPLDAEIQRIFDATGNNAVFPLYAPRSLNLGGDGNLTLTNKEHSEYQKAMGKKSYSYAENIMKNPEYKSLSDDEKAGILEKAYKLSNALVKEEMFDHTTDSDKKLKEVARNGSAKDVAQYLIDGVKAKQQGTTIDKYRKEDSTETPKETVTKSNSKGISTTYKVVGKGTTPNQSTSTGEAIPTSAKELGIKQESYDKVVAAAGANADKVLDALPSLKRNGISGTNAYLTYVQATKTDPSLTTANFIKTFNAIDTDNSKGIKQDELLEYFNNNKTKEAEAQKMWNMYGLEWKQVPYLKKDGTWGKHKAK